MGVKRRQDYAQNGSAIYKSQRWKFVRLAAKRRDGFQCVAVIDGRRCPNVHELEVDHIKRVKDAPELAFELSNLQTLCKPCHSAKTKIECGFGAALDPKRHAWRDLVAAMVAKRQPQKETTC